LLAAYGILFSDRSLLFMMVFPLKAKHFVWVLAGIEFMTLVFSPGGGLSSVAHLTGMGAGVGYLWIATKVALRLRENPKKRKGNLKLVVNNQDEKSPEPPPARKDNKTWH
jgi:membrane associated rhomboid family serine protease